MSLAYRSINGSPVQKQKRGYGIERAPITTVGGAANWLWDARSESGDRIWFGESSREHAGRHLLWLRFLHHDRWIERGGRDG